MRKLFLLAMATVFLAACQPDDNTPETGVIGKWELVEARSSWGLPTTPVSDLPFSDSYEFRTNGTFVKFNTHFGHELPGTYELKDYDDESKGLTLIFTSENLDTVMPTHEDGSERNFSHDPSYFIIYGQSRKEVLSLGSDGSLSNGGYAIMDGPIYIYRK